MVLHFFRGCGLHGSYLRALPGHGPPVLTGFARVQTRAAAFSSALLSWASAVLADVCLQPGQSRAVVPNRALLSTGVPAASLDT